VTRSSEPNNPIKSSFAPPKQEVNRNSQIFYDDDEDLRILINDENLVADPELEKRQDEISQHIR